MVLSEIDQAFYLASWLDSGRARPTSTMANCHAVSIATLPRMEDG